MDNQVDSPFFSLPLEIRDAIYAYLIPNNIAVHLSSRLGNVAITRCLAPVISGYLDGSERFPGGDEPTNSRDIPRKAIWMRRLRSSWGPHWKCEENVQRPAGEHKCPLSQATLDGEVITVLLVVCRKM